MGFKLRDWVRRHASASLSHVLLSSEPVRDRPGGTLYRGGKDEGILGHGGWLLRVAYSNGAAAVAGVAKRLGVLLAQAGALPWMLARAENLWRPILSSSGRPIPHNAFVVSNAEIGFSITTPRSSGRVRYIFAVGQCQYNSTIIAREAVALLCASVKV